MLATVPGAGSRCQRGIGHGEVAADSICALPSRLVRRCGFTSIPFAPHAVPEHSGAEAEQQNVAFGVVQTSFFVYAQRGPRLVGCAVSQYASTQEPTPGAVQVAARAAVTGICHFARSASGLLPAELLSCAAAVRAVLPVTERRPVAAAVSLQTGSGRAVIGLPPPFSFSFFARVPLRSRASALSSSPARPCSIASPRASGARATRQFIETPRFHDCTSPRKARSPLSSCLTPRSAVMISSRPAPGSPPLNGVNLPAGVSCRVAGRFHRS